MKKSFFALICLCAGALLFSAEDAPGEGSEAVVTGEGTVIRRHLSVEEAVELAVQNNLSLEASRVALNGKQRAARYSWNNFLPTVSAAASLGANNEVSSSYKTVPLPLDGLGYDNIVVTGFDMTKQVEGVRWTLGGQVSIQWTGLNVALIEGLRQVKSDYSAGLISLNAAKIQLEENIRKLYLQLTIARENLAVQEDSLRLAEESVASAEKSYRAGLSSELTLLQARVNRDNLIPQVEQTRDSIKTASANFAMLIGLPFDTVFEFDPISLDNTDLPFDVDDLVKRAASGKPDIQALKAAIITDKHSRNALRLNLFTPSLSVGWSYAPAFTGDAFKDSWGDSDKWKDGGKFSFALSWSLNGVLPFTKEYQNLSALNDKLRADDINLAQSVLQTELDIYNTVYTLRQARESLIAQRRTVELAERTYALTLQAFNAGLQDFITLQNTEAQLRQARAGVLQQELNFLSSIIDLEYAIGVPFGTLSDNK